MSERPCFLYRAYDADDRLLYVGITFNVSFRMRAHARKSKWHGAASRIDVETFPSRRDAMAAEAREIRTLRPPFNVAQGCDDEDLTDAERAEVAMLEAEIERLAVEHRAAVAPLRAEVARIRTRGRVRKLRARP